MLFPDVASADQQKAAGPQQDQDEDENDEDVAMETENQEEDLQAADVHELKPEQLDSTKASQKGDSFDYRHLMCLLDYRLHVVAL